MADIAMKLTVNGRTVERAVRPNMRVLDFLREDLNLTGSKEGCGAGECGTCSVFIDGALVKSCMVPVAKVRGADIQTVEGLAPRGEMTAVQRAFHKTGASQCGYCIPGMVMAATATLRDNPDAGLEEIKQGLGGNICRCTGYQKIFEAVELARDVINGALPETVLDEDAPGESYIGANVRRLDAPSKVSGRLRYAGDMVVPDMLHMQTLRSPRPHARIKSIDISAAEAMAGVAAVVTISDVPGEDGFGVFVHDQPTLADGVVRYVGEAIAAVAAETEAIARAAVAMIRVDYEDLPALFDAESAMEDGAVVIHDYAPDNVTFHVPIRKGDMAKGFAEADLIVAETYRTQPIEHAYLEPEAGLAYEEADGTITIHSPSQNITHHRHALSRILAMPVNKVRMIMSPVGGGFGGKEDMHYQGFLALAALKAGRPVRYVFTREESIAASAKRHGFTIRYRMGLKRDGRITATEMHMIADGGAYGCSTEGVMRKAAILAAGPYNIANVKIDAIGVYTNNTPGGAMRSFGALQSEFATESHLDLCAERLGIDPFEIRRVNMMQDGAVTHTRQKLGSVSIGRVMDAAAAAAGWEDGPPSMRGATRGDLGGPGNRQPCTLRARIDGVARAARSTGVKRRGRGAAASWYGIARTATTDRAGAWAELDDGGTAKIVTGVTEIGEGILTVLAQVAADELGVRPEDITLGDNDTARAPEAAHAGATRQTYMISNAVALACRDARTRFDAVVADHWGVGEDEIEAASGVVWARDHHNLRMPIAEAVALCKSKGVVPVGAGSFTSEHTGLDPKDGSGRPWQAYVFGTQIAEVEVDTATGEVQVLGVWAAHDIGRVVNPRGVEGQIEGGVVQALGQALMEDYIQVDGHTTTPGFAKYILPTSLDVPHVTSVLIEDHDPHNPLGVKGIGEPAMVPTAPAIMNAIYDAVGVRITSLPATPEKVLSVLREKRKAETAAANAAVAE
jgi:CO/xanthine dehydrogenase Mo-binding subunit/aerobic-type carbon monoxide dehydrogenase small subunit (CoxS/CutS family)